MPYAEFRSWKMFAMLEPFGFDADEYHTAALLAMLYNVNRGKGKPKDVKDFMRNMTRAVLSELDQQPAFEDLQREEQIRKIKKDFGIT